MSHAASAADAGSAGTSDGTSRKQSGRAKAAGLFDIRTFIAALLGFDGLVILLMGLFGDQSTSAAETPPININLWAGIGLIVAAVVFETWKRLRPVKVVEPPPGSDEAPRAAH